MADAAEPAAAPAGTPEHTVDIAIAAPAAPNVELVDSDAEQDGPPPPAPQASPRKLYVYTRADLLRLASSPMVKAPAAMPSLKEWYGDFYESSSTPLKKDSDAPSGRERTRFRHGDDGESSARPSFKPSYSQSTQMGNFKHQSLRDRERDTAERDRDGERLRSLSDKYDRDRLSGTATSPLSSRQARDRDTAPHLPAGASQRISGATSSTSRKVETKEGPKRKGDVSEDWRRGIESARGGRDDRLEAPRRDRERARDPSRQRERDRDDGRRERDDRRGDRDRDRDERDRDDRRRERGRERDTGDRERDREEDPRHWRDDGRRDERLAARRDRDRDDYTRSRERRADRDDRDAPDRESRRNNRDDRESGDSKRDKDVEEGESKPSRRGGREREGRRTAAAADDEKADKERKERQKEQPAWMETYVPDSAGGGILGGAEDGRMDDLQAWKKEMRGKMEKDKAAADLLANPSAAPNAPAKAAESGGVDELATIKLMIKRAQETPPAATATPVQDPAIVAAIPSSAQAKPEQENGISGLRRIMGKDMKTDDAVLRTAGISSSSARRPASSRPNDLVDSSDFESGLSAANASTSTPVLAQQSTMDGTAPKATPGGSHPLDSGFGTSRLEAMLRDSSNAGPASSAYPPAKAPHDPAIAGASITQPPQPRLFSLQAHAQSAALREQGAQHMAPGRPPSTSLVNNQAIVQPDMNSRLNIDTTSPDPMNRQGAFSPFEQTGRGPMSPPLGVSAAEGRTRGPGAGQRPSVSSADGITPLERINTSSAMIGSGQSDQPISPQSAAGYGQSKGSRFAKFFHERTPAAAAAAQAQAAAGISHLLPPQQQQAQQQQQHVQQAPPAPQPTPSVQRTPATEGFTPHSLGPTPGNQANLQDLLSMLQQGSSMQNPPPPVRMSQERTYMRETDDLRQSMGRQPIPGPAVGNSYVHQQAQPLHLLNRVDAGGYDNHISQEQLLQQLRAGARSRERPPHLTSPGMFAEADDFGAPYAPAPPRLAPAQQVMFEQLQGHAAARQQQQQQMFAGASQQRAMGLPPVGGPGAGFRPVPSPSQHLVQPQQPRGMPASLATLGQRPPLDPSQFMGSGMLSPQQQAQQQFGGFGGHSGFTQQQPQQQRNPMLGADFTVQARTQLPPGHALSPGLRGAPFGNAGQQLGQQQIGMRGGQQLPPHMSHLAHGPPPPHMQLQLSPPGPQPMGSNPSDLMALLLGGNRSLNE
ncbi:hypothetical protein AURDEDRAFT_179104 [Auricularia subglabra TFB-10046 SS5]|nr:hypothetical protein AURDEDRAFT_179104 [Auricularia subglabra TFB-10046 SS5]